MSVIRIETITTITSQVINHTRRYPFTTEYTFAADIVYIIIRISFIRNTSYYVRVIIHTIYYCEWRIVSIAIITLKRQRIELNTKHRAMRTLVQYIIWCVFISKEILFSHCFSIQIVHVVHLAVVRLFSSLSFNIKNESLFETQIQ